MSGILIYGGDGYHFHAIVGEWREFPESRLMLRDGLREGEDCSGVGWAGHRPFVFLRRLESPNRRGGYPLTILMDPDEACWSSLGWNAALLCEALRAHCSSLDRVLESSTNPRAGLEGLMASALDLRIRPTGGLATSWWAPESDSNEALFADAWVGACCSSFQVGALPFSYLKSKAPSRILDLARWLETLPPCFRLGPGWMVGGDEGLAASYSSAIQLRDENPSIFPLTSGDLSDWIDRGRRVRLAWENLRLAPGAEIALGRLAPRPAAKGEVALGPELHELFLAAAAWKASSEDDALFRSVRAHEEQAGRSLEHLAWNGLIDCVVSRSSGPLGEEATVFSLECWRRRQLRAAFIRGRLESNRAVAFLTEIKWPIRNDGSLESPLTAPELRLLVLAWPSVAELPEVLLRVAEFMDEGEFEACGAGALARSRGLSLELEQMVAALSALVGPERAAVLVQAELRERQVDRSPGWALDLVDYADVGLALVAPGALADGRVDELVEASVRRLAQNSHHASARKCLDFLATRSECLAVPASLCVRAAALVSGSWSELAWLAAARQDGRVELQLPSFDDSPFPSSSFFWESLRELLRVVPAGDRWRLLTNLAHFHGAQANPTLAASRGSFAEERAIANQKSLQEVETDRSPKRKMIFGVFRTK